MDDFLGNINPYTGKVAAGDGRRKAHHGGLRLTGIQCFACYTNCDNLIVDADPPERVRHRPITFGTRRL